MLDTICKGMRTLLQYGITIHIWLGIVLTVIVGCSRPGPVNLAGQWHYRLNVNEVGEQEKWFLQKFGENNQKLPAALRDHNTGNTPPVETQWTGGICDSSWYLKPEMAKYRSADPPKFPFWLTHVKRYAGKAWYQRETSLPGKWKGRELELLLERPHRQTKFWFDSLLIGDQNSLSTPHIYTIPSKGITKGKHRITICVDNAIRMTDPGINSHSLSDHAQGNWNGIVGKMKLRPLENVLLRSFESPRMFRSVSLARVPVGLNTPLHSAMANP